MPPSGYDLTQADAVTSFLRSCSEALRKEADDRSESADAALRREIKSIAMYLK